MEVRIMFQDNSRAICEGQRGAGASNYNITSV